jgi:hypothetical protein
VANSNQAKKPEDEPKLPVPTTGTALQVIDFGGLEGLGTEDLGARDQPTPLLRIVHYACPQTDENDAKFIYGAKPGMIMDVSVGEVWEGQRTGLDMVVCGTKRRYQEWIPRPDKSGRPIVRVRSGNFRGFHEVTDPVIQRLVAQHGDFKPLPWENADGETVSLTETGELFILFAPPPLTAANAQRAMVNFQSSSLKTWQMYNGRHGRARFAQPNGKIAPAPLCFWRWRLRSQPEQNDQGKFFTWSIELASKVANPEIDSYFLDNQVMVQDPELYEMAVASLKQYRTGAVREYRPDDDLGGGSAVDLDDPPF